MTSFSSPTATESGTDSSFQLSETSVSASLSSLLSQPRCSLFKKTTLRFLSTPSGACVSPALGSSCPHSLHWLKSDPFQVSTHPILVLLHNKQSPVPWGSWNPQFTPLMRVFASSRRARHCLRKSLPCTGLEFIRAGSSPQDVLHQGVQARRASSTDVLALLLGTQSCYHIRS